MELYVVTDPSFVEKSKDEMLENARKPIYVFRQHFDLLAYWAQCHVLALGRSKLDGEFANQVMNEHPAAHINSQFLEDIGDEFMQSIVHIDCLSTI